jgi:hypothetical protein
LARFELGKYLRRTGATIGVRGNFPANLEYCGAKSHIMAALPEL